MARLLCLVGSAVVFVAAGTAHANDAQSCEDRFFPDRPGATNGHRVVGQGCFQLESGVGVSHGSDTTGLSLPTLFRAGFVDSMELRLETGWFDATFPEAGDASFDAPAIGLGVKFQAHDADAGFGLLVGASALPTDDFGESITPYTSLLLDLPFADRWGLTLNGGASAPPDDAGGNRAPQLDLAASLGFSPPVEGDWLGLFVDSAAGSRLRRDSDWFQSVGAGASFGVASNVQLDVSGALTLTEDDLPFDLGAGIAWRF